MIKISKALLYCNKSKPYLLCEPYMDENKPCRLLRTNMDKVIYNCAKENAVNGKIVAECDFEVEKIIPINVSEDDYDYGLSSGKNLLKDSCLYNEDICEYLDDYNGETIFKKGYAIHIKNLHIFDEPKELSEFLYEDDTVGIWPVERTPKNYTIIATDVEDIGGVYCCRGTYGRFLALSSQELYDVLNGKKTVIIRKTVSKEML